MTWPELQTQIESTGFAVRLGACSGKKMFLRALGEAQELNELLEVDCRDILLRIAQIASIATDDRYENPYDIALAAYLYALDSLDAEYGYVAATVVSFMPRLFWAGFVVRELFEGRGLRMRSDIK